MDIPTPFKNKKKKYLLVEPSRWGADTIMGIMELTLNDTMLNFNGDNFIIVDIRPMIHTKLKSQGEIFALYMMKDGGFSVGSQLEDWLNSDDGKGINRNEKIDDVLNG